MVLAGLLSLPILFFEPIIATNFEKIVSSNGGFFWFLLGRMVIIFSFGAIASACYENYFHFKFTKNKHSERQKLFWSLCGIVVTIFFFVLLKFSLIASIASGLFFNILIILIMCPYLIWDMLFSGFFMGLLYLVMYLVCFRTTPLNSIHLWFSDISMGLTLAGISLEVLMTIYLFGFFWGSLYVASKDRRENSRNK